MAAEHGMSEFHEARFARGDLAAERTGLAYHVLRPGKRQPFVHRHKEAEEIVVVLSGSGRMKVDDEILELEPMDAVRVSPDAARALEAGDGAPLEILVFGPHHEQDAEMVDDSGFWGD